MLAGVGHLGERSHAGVHRAAVVEQQGHGDVVTGLALVHVLTEVLQVAGLAGQVAADVEHATALLLVPRRGDVGGRLLKRPDHAIGQVLRLSDDHRGSVEGWPM